METVLWILLFLIPLFIWIIIRTKVYNKLWIKIGIVITCAIIFVSFIWVAFYVNDQESYIDRTNRILWDTYNCVDEYSYQKETPEVIHNIYECFVDWYASLYNEFNLFADLKTLE